jgi:hypothetical protein
MAYYIPAISTLSTTVPNLTPVNYYTKIKSPLAGNGGHQGKDISLPEILKTAATDMKIRQDLVYNVKTPRTQRKERKVAPENSSKSRPASAKKPAPVQKQGSHKKPDAKKKPRTPQTTGRKPTKTTSRKR